MKCEFHHAHLFASDIDESSRFYRDMFGAEPVLDDEIAGSRNVLLKLGAGHLNFYDQGPRVDGRVIHHLGIRTDDLTGLVARMKEKGFRFRKGIRDLGVLRYVMAGGPDGQLLELFETSLDGSE